MSVGNTFECYLTYACNQRCAFCFVSDEYRSRHGQIELRSLAGDMLRMRKNGVTDLSLLGGEPTVHPDIEKIIAAGRCAGYRKILMFTNGQRFSDRAFAARMKKAGLSAVNVSVHGHTPQVHDAVTGVRGSFDRMVAGVKNLVELGIEPGLICVVQKLNYLDLYGTMRFYWGLGIRRFVLFFMKYQGRVLDDKKRAALFILDAVRAAGAVKKAFRFFEEKKAAPPLLEHFPPCVLPGYEERMLDFYPDMLAAQSEGSVCVHPGERVESTHSLAYKGFVYLDGCARCRLRYGCQGIDPGYLKAFGPDGLKPVLKVPRPFYASWPAQARKTARKR